MRKGRVTIKDVAQAAEVNPSVVSRILNHDETLVVRPETRERVWGAVQQMGYRPNATARSLRTRKNRLIAIVISGFLDPYFALILENENRVADQRGYVVGVLSTESDDQRGAKCLETIFDTGMAGAVLASSYIEESTLARIRYSDMPMVLLRRNGWEFGKMSIMEDENSGAALAMEHLISLGHTRIAHIAGSLYSRSGLKRLEGYRKALHVHGIPYRAEYMQESDEAQCRLGVGQTRLDGYRAMLRLLDLDERPTAVFAFNDTIALGAVDAVLERALRIPEDISIIGYGNTMSEFNFPKLTTVDGQMARIGALAAEMLINAIESESGEYQHEEILIQPELVVRKTTAPPPET